MGVSKVVRTVLCAGIAVTRRSFYRTEDCADHYLPAMRSFNS